MRGQMNPRTPLAFFSICAVVDFVFGLVKFHSVVGDKKPGDGMLTDEKPFC